LEKGNLFSLCFEIWGVTESLKDWVLSVEENISIQLAFENS
jgi:hypothetical protein